MSEYREGELIVYQNGDRFEIGKIKRLTDTGAFVWYSSGDTAAKTPYEVMHKLTNAYTIEETTLGGTRRKDTTAKADAWFEEMWRQLTDIPMDPVTERIEQPFFHWPSGTPREDIWRWFDERHSKGVAYLLYGGADTGGNE